MRIEIFDVGHGACAAITCPNGKILLIDCGHSNDRPWYPSIHFSGYEIEELIISNYDEDHVSDLEDFMKNTKLRFITKNSSVSSKDLANLKMENGIGSGIKRLQNWMSLIEQKQSSGGTPDLKGISKSYYYNNYPSDFKDENNLSIVTIIEYNGFKILFGGDIEEAGWLKLLQNPSFKANLSDINVFVASHHGRKSGCCDEIMDIATPQIIVMSDKDKMFDTQETVPWYRNKCLGNGVSHKGKSRKIFTTRSDGDISIDVGVVDWKIKTSK